MALVLITGARGFIGQHLALRLAADGHTVCGLGHGAWPDHEAAHFGISRWLNGEIAAANLKLLQRDCGTPNHVVHLAGGSSVGAALANPREDFFRTVATTAELLDWIRADAPDCELLAVSSAAVYGAGHDGPIAEESVLNPYSPYGHHKRLMEELCRSYGASFGVRVLIARLFSVYGTGLTKQLLWDSCSKLQSGASPLLLSGTGNERRDWTEVRDVAAALGSFLSLGNAEVPVVNVGTGTGTSVRDVLQALMRAWVEAGQAEVPVQFNGKSRLGDPFSLIAQNQRLENTRFCWQRNLQDGLRDYVRWFLLRQGSGG